MGVLSLDLLVDMVIVQGLHGLVIEKVSEADEALI